MVNKDDVMELHSTIVAMKKSQERMKKLADSFQKEVEDMDDLIQVLEREYQSLKEKAGS